MKPDVDLVFMVLTAGAVALGAVMLSVGTTLGGFVLLFVGLLMAFVLITQIVDTRR